MIEVPAHVDRVLLARLASPGSRPAVLHLEVAAIRLLLNLFLLLVVGQLVRDLLVRAVNARGKDLNSLSLALDEHCLSNSNDGARGLRGQVGEGQAHVEGHVWLHQGLIGLIDRQNILFDVIADLLRVIIIILSLLQNRS